MKDVFGQDVHVGDKVAVGMAYNRSSVLRVGEIEAINEKPRPYSNLVMWTVRVRWTHDGDKREHKTYGSPKVSTIKVESNYYYAKLVVLPPGYAEQFPPDIPDTED